MCKTISICNGSYHVHEDGTINTSPFFVDRDFHMMLNILIGYWAWLYSFAMRMNGMTRRADMERFTMQRMG